jgi:O-antigen ligase
VTSTFGNYNHLAGYLEMAIPLILGLFLTGFRRVRLFLMIYLTSLMLAAIILSLSRGGWIGFLIGLVFMTAALVTNRYFEHRKLMAALAGGFVVVALVVLASTPVVERIRTFEQRGETPNFRVRVTVWGGTVEMIRDHPLLGTGPGTFATVFTQYQPPGFVRRYFMAHNDYLHFTSEVGLPLVIILAWMIIALYRTGFNKLKNPSRLVRGATLGALSGVTAILFHSIVDFNLHIPANALLFTVLAAIVVAPVSKHDHGRGYQL